MTEKILTLLTGAFIYKKDLQVGVASIFDELIILI